LRNQAKESIRQYVTEQYQLCLTALDAIIKHAFNILETSPDNREKMQAMELFEDIHLVKMELLYTATTIDSALHYSESSSNNRGIMLALLDSTTDATSNDDCNNSGDGIKM
jgi:hypothetical protein